MWGSGGAEGPQPRNSRRCAVRRLLPLVGDAESAVLRRGAVGTLRNCCFEHGEGGGRGCWGGGLL